MKVRYRMQIVWVLAIVCLVGAAACGGGSTATEGGGESDSAKVAVAPMETAMFTTVLPENWEVMSDALDKMGMMTLAKKGTGGKVGVYLKFEGHGNWGGDPLTDIQAFSEKQQGTPAEMATINGIEWAGTTYEAYGMKQTMYVTKHNGTKVTATVLGETSDPGVQAILNAFTLK